MSNHLHLVVTDGFGQLADFMCAFLSPLAKSINALDGVWGPVFERRYAATQIVDDEALLHCIAYTVTNPVAAGLVDSPEAWPGLLLWRTEENGRVFTRIRWRELARAQALRGCEIDRSRYTDTSCFSVRPPRLGGSGSVDDIKIAVEQRLRELNENRLDRSVLGAEAAARHSPFDAPVQPKRSRMPLCHASTRELWNLFATRWREFLRDYRRASAAFRRGDLDVSFPPFCFRPWSVNLG